MEKTHSDRTKEGLRAAAALGRRGGRKPKVTTDQIRAVIHLGTKAGADAVGLSVAQFIRRRKDIESNV